MPIPLLLQFAYGALCPLGLLGSPVPGATAQPAIHPVALHTAQAPLPGFAAAAMQVAAKDSIVLVDIVPDSGQDLPKILVAEVAKARALGRTPFVEVGGSNCPSCVELHRLLRTTPIDPHLLEEFAGTYIIALSIDKWPGDVNNLTSIGLPSPIRGIPLVLAIDEKGQSTATMYGDEWGDNNPEGLVPLQKFFQAHVWTSKSKANTKRNKGA